MEITWNTITESEKNFHYKNIFSNYDLYVCADYNELDLANIVGSRYFLFDLGIDEIVELFNEMTISGYSNNMTDFYTFIMFFFKKSFYNKNVTREEADKIWRKYFGNVIKINEYHSVKYKQETSEFISKLISYKDTEDDFVYKTFLKYLEDLKYSW